MFTTWSPDFQAPYATETPLRVPASAYTNETNVAQAKPLPYVAPVVDYSGSFANTTGWTPVKTSVPTPVNPAAASPPSGNATLHPNNVAKLQHPVVWVGVAAGILLLLWTWRR